MDYGNETKITESVATNELKPSENLPTAFPDSSFATEPPVISPTTVPLAQGGTLNGNRLVGVPLNKLEAGAIVSKTINLEVQDGLGDSYIASGKTDFTNTDPGFILGVDDSDSNTAKFYIGNSTQYLNWDGTDLIINGYRLQSFTSTVTIGSADTERSIDQNSYTKIKEFYITVPGVYNVYFEVTNSDNAFNTYGRIYKNGVAVGTERTAPTAAWDAYNEDVSVSTGDLIQFYGKKDATKGAPFGQVRNFRLRAALGPKPTVNTD